MGIAGSQKKGKKEMQCQGNKWIHGSFQACATAVSPGSEQPASPMHTSPNLQKLNLINPATLPAAPGVTESGGAARATVPMH